jgi:predicted unusual protein kinase regulating ubiquinone biosynthesis (AarF/ABC1/UbiB family)
MAPGEPAPSPFQRYDANAIARYYRWRFPSVLWRSLQILSQVVGFAIGLRLDDLLGASDRRKAMRAMQLRKMLTRLGPTFIKIGQALSTRPDLIRKDFLDELTLLQDQLPAVPNALAYRIIEAELGLPVDEIFKEFSEKPVAAASLGQVYQGHLYSGEKVAIKVQRPGLAPILARDLYILRKLVRWVGPWLPLNLGHDLTEIVDEFGIKLFEEIDYDNERRNAEQFARNFANNPNVKIPYIYPKYSARRVLTLEWIDGFKLTATQCLLDANINQDDIVRIGVISSLQQLLEFGFFHADPHPGNLFAMADGRMAYIDFGMMDQLDQATKETLVDALVHLINSDYTALASDFVRLGFLSPETDIRPIIPALEAVFADMIGVSVRDFNFKSITDRFSELMFEYPFRLPAKFALIIRSLVTQEGVALCLNPDFKIVEVSYPYIAQRLLTEETPEFRRRLLEVLFKDGRFQWQRLENLVAIARTDQSFNLLPTAGVGLKFLLSDEGQYLRQQLILALIEDDRLHAAEVQHLWDLVKDDFQLGRLWKAAVDAIATFSGEAVSQWSPMVALGQFRS